MAKQWKFSFQLRKEEVLIWTLDNMGTILECDLPKYEVMVGHFLLLSPEDYKVGEKPDLFDNEFDFKSFPHKILYIEELEVDDA